MRRPRIDQRVIESLDAVQARFTPADCADPVLAPGLNYLVALAKHFRSPEAALRRRAVTDRSLRRRRKAKGEET